MSSYVVLSTSVEREFAEKVSAYCRENGLTPSALIRALLEEEINGKKALTTIYNDIGKMYNDIGRMYKEMREHSASLHKLVLECLRHAAITNSLLPLLIEYAILDKFKEGVPVQLIDVIKNLDRIRNESIETLKEINALYEKIYGSKKEGE